MAAMAERIGGAGRERYQRRRRQGTPGVFAQFILPDGNGASRRHRRTGRGGSEPAPQPDFRGEPAGEPARSGAAACGLAPLPRAVVDFLRPALVGPRGITYCSHCLGPASQRDAAYHQGTVWAWLLGPWALANYRVYGDAASAQRFEPVGDHLADAGLGQISEIFDGDPPHAPRGCPAQAWSVACVLEAWWRLERAKSAGKPRFTDC